jgi:hypothetical protein
MGGKVAMRVIIIDPHESLTYINVITLFHCKKCTLTHLFKG